jgi:hypothetical protein
MGAVDWSTAPKPYCNLPMKKISTGRVIMVIDAIDSDVTNAMNGARHLCKEPRHFCEIIFCKQTVTRRELQ